MINFFFFYPAFNPYTTTEFPNTSASSKEMEGKNNKNS